MITLVDRTLSTVPVSGSKEAVFSFIRAVFEAGVNVVEIPDTLYLELGRELPAEGKYILRLSRTSDPSQYPEFHRFVATGSSYSNTSVLETFYLPEWDSRATWRLPPILRSVRLSVDAGSGSERTETMFRRYRESFLGFIELEPTGGVREASSLAAEWMVAGGSCAVGTVGGVGGFADVCELAVFLQTARRRRVFVTPEQIECLYRALAVLTEQPPAAPVSSVSVDSFASCQTVKYVYDRIGSPIPSEKLKTLTVRLRAEVARRGRLLKDQELVSVWRDFMKNR